MKRISLILCALVFLFGCRSTRMHQYPSEISRISEIVWVGLDYSMVRMIGIDAFRDTKAIFPGYLNKWNDLFFKKKIKELSSRLEKPIKIETSAVEKVNKSASEKQILQKEGGPQDLTASHITQEDLAKAVGAYTLQSKIGVGLVFIMDRLVKSEGRGYIYVVFFDIETRKIILRWRKSYPASGFGFRNYWFNPIKETLRDL